MDNKFLEFWGQMLIQIAKGQRQYDDMFRWMNQGFAGLEEIVGYFKKNFPMDQKDEENSDYLQNLTKTAEQFRKSYYDYLNFFGMIPKQEYINLVKKYEELKEKVATQEETIKHLRMLLANKEPDQSELMNKYQELLKSQKDQFQQLLSNIQKFYQIPKPSVKEES